MEGQGFGGTETHRNAHKAQKRAKMPINAPFCTDARNTPVYYTPISMHPIFLNSWITGAMQPVHRVCHRDQAVRKKMIVSKFRREFKRQMKRGNRTESLWEGNLPLRKSLRGSLRGRVFGGLQKFLEIFRGFLMLLEGFKRFWEVFRDFTEVFRGPLRDPLRGRFPSQRLSALLPLIVLPLECSPNFGRIP